MLSSHFFPCHFMVLLCFPREYLTVFHFFFPLELSGFALRVTAPLIVLAVWKMVCCSLSVGSLLLNAASGTPEHLDRSIGLSWLYFPHCPRPGDVCNNWREHTSLRVTSWSADPDPDASVVRMGAFWMGEGHLRTGMACARAVPVAPQTRSVCSEPTQRWGLGRISH